MALLEDTLGSLGTAVLLGVGAALVAPVLFPAAGAVLRPVAKGLIKGGLYLVDTAQEILAEGSEQLSDLVAEVKAERAAAATTQTHGQTHGQ
jgi:predicted tellurium resistance membrane protein TerC